ncbi:hypothetical protein OENI_760001 [Oenococcus oeni]|nr:hypothetical protein OENI_760001 [Oenococcus oeni]
MLMWNKSLITINFGPSEYFKFLYLIRVD